MSKLILARAGQDKDNAEGILTGRRDMPLTNLGVNQAYRLADKLTIARIKIGCIFSSPCQRSTQTAWICARMLGLSRVIIVPFLVERSHGILEGRPYSDIPTLSKSYREVRGRTYVLEVENGEGYPQLCQRAKIALSQIKVEIRKLKVDGNVLVVSPGAIGRAMEIAHRGLTHERIFELASFENGEFRVLQ